MYRNGRGRSRLSFSFLSTRSASPGSRQKIGFIAFPGRCS
jgi:hypothetical protein